MRRGKTAIKAIVLGFSLPVASFSYPARKKSLILRLLLPELSIFAAGQKDRRLWGREWVLTKRSAASEEENVYIEETELRKADRTVGVNCNIFSNISSGTA